MRPFSHMCNHIAKIGKHNRPAYEPQWMYVCVCLLQFLAITIQFILIDWNGSDLNNVFVCYSITRSNSLRFFTDWQPADNNKPFNWLRLFTLSQCKRKKKKPLFWSRLTFFFLGGFTIKKTLHMKRWWNDNTNQK